MIVYGAFKGMGDAICAAPAIKSALDSGEEVMVLMFPKAAPILDLLDFGVNSGALRLRLLPVPGSGISFRSFFREMSQIKPSRIYISAHAPLVVASRKIPVLLWVLKRLLWPGAKLIGADSEPWSGLFDARIPVSRDLPYMTREWKAYAHSRMPYLRPAMPRIRFKDAIAQRQSASPSYDLVIHPGAGTQNRRWPAARIVELVSLLPSSCRLALVGVSGDIAELRAILPSDQGIHFLSGSLEEAIMSIGRSRVALTMDSGSMFFARLLGIPTVTLFGPSDPANVMESESSFVPIYQRAWACQPCRRPECRHTQTYCMDSIAPSVVLTAVLELMRANP